MAFPTTLTGIQDNVGYATKPFISSAGNVYVFGRLASATDRLRAVKATDPTTSFSAVGTDVEMVDTVAMAACIDAVQVGDVIHIVTGTGGTSAFYIHYHTFNMATDAWTISAEVVKSNFPLVDFNVENRGVGIAVRSDGDVIVFYNGTYDTITSTNYARVKYARRESAVWTIDVAVDNGTTKNWVSGGAVLGSSDRTHFFFDSFTNDDGYQRTLTSANVLETFPAAYDTAVNGSGREQGKAVTYESGGVTKVRYSYSDSASDSVSVVKFDSADAPTITEDVDVTGTSAVENNYYVSGLAVDGTTLWHAYVADLSDDIFTQSNADDAGWSGVTNRIAGTFNSVRANIYTRGTDIVLAFVYAAAGADALYNELDIGDASGSINSGALSAAAVAALTWGAASTASSALDSDAAATLTWNGASTVTSNLSAVAAASLTWNGASVGSAALSAAAAATLTWVGVEAVVAAAAWSAAAAATLELAGASTASSDLDADAVATLAWNGAADASSNLSAVAAATLTWNGVSTAGAAFDSDAADTLTWSGTEVHSAVFDADAAATLTWAGAAVAISSAALSAAAAASLTWNGTEVRGAAFDADAVASLALAGASNASSGWNASPVATLTWTGVEVSDASLGDWSAAAVAELQAAGASIVAAAASIEAVASAVFAGADATAAVDQNLDGWRLNRVQLERFEDIEEEDILILTAALFNYLENCNGYH